MQSPDMSLALKSTEGDVDLLKDVIEAFLEEYPLLLAEIGSAIESANSAAVQRASHTIKGPLRLFGEVPAHEFSRRLEEIGQSGDLANAEPTLQSLKSSLETLRQQLLESMKTL